MHRVITGAGKGIFVDHKDSDSLNNQRCNLRLCTHRQNNQNRQANKNSGGGFKGVSWYKPSKKWRAQITVNDKNRHLGLFANEPDAARCYNAAALALHGEFARLNKIPND